ncbi:MAG TPA: thioredoxin-like domain-containing protein, partial [Chitinophagaceae bacterium]|nr:thioredoxin-like domain-containing protein [Chitinophagaceae bacterium]
FVLSCVNNNSPDSSSNIVSDSDSITFRARMQRYEKLYADPNSPYRNEAAAVTIYDSILASPYYNSAEKMAIRKKLQLARQNRVGQQANDFIYYAPSGAAESLYLLKADYTLLYFYNPECNACKEMKNTLIASPILKQNINTGKLKILAIYPDPDSTLWKKHLPELPQEWIHGRDKQQYLWENKIYDLRAIPTIYLLDKDKKVLLKDCMDIAAIEHALS